MENYRVLELFSGIGGMHAAFKISKVGGEIVAAYEINPLANSVYKFNFPGTNLLQRNIEAITAEEIVKLKPDIILMSPPCQPFTRSGNQLGLEDKRSICLIKLMELIPELTGVKYILLENVWGFETSTARHDLVKLLNNLEFNIQEFLISPHDFNIPNIRNRYYLLAKKLPNNFKYKSKNSTNFIKRDANEEYICDIMNFLNIKCQQLQTTNIKTIKDILENLSTEDEELHNVPEKFLERFVWQSEFVTCDSNNSSCFTKAYRRYFKGSGSILLPNIKSKEYIELFSKLDIKPNSILNQEQIDVFKNLKPRFFTPKEMLRLMCYPEQFNFPNQVTFRQSSALIGNSINVLVVASLINYLIQNSD